MTGRPALLACVFGLLSSMAVTLPAAQPATETAPAVTSSTAPIPVAGILSRADADEAFAAGVIRRAAAGDPSERLLRHLEEIAASVEQKHLALTSEQLQRLSVMRLESLARHWSFDVRRYTDWQRQVRLAYARTADDATDVAVHRAEWEATRQSPEAAALPTVMVSRIPAVIGALDRAEAALAPRLAMQISLGRRGSALRERIQEGQDEVTAAIADVDRRLLRIDAPPLWSRQDQPGDAEGFQKLLEGIGIEARFAADYARFDTFTRATRVLQLLLLPLLLWLSWRHRSAAGGDATHESAWNALQRPWSAWLLLVMMLVLTLETDAPLLVRQLVMVVALVPVLRQLTPQFRARYAPWPLAITGLYLLNILGFLLVSNAHLYRLHGLGIAVAGAVLATVLLLRARARDSHPTDREVHVLRLAGWFSVGLLALSALANFSGNISLAEMLVSGTVDSAYLALALYAGLQLITGLLHTLLSERALARLARTHARPLEQLLVRLLRMAAVIGWILYSLENFRVLRPTYRAVRETLSHTLNVGQLSISLGHIVVFVGTVFVAYWAARVIRLVLQEEILSRMSLPRGVGNSIASLTYYALLLVGWLFALSAAGVKLSQLTLLLGALGVGIGFGLQNVVNNFVSGLILMFERPLQPGDIVEIGDAAGRVREIGMRATTIHTFEGADLVVPNGTVLSANLRNWTLTDRRRRIQVNVGVAHGTDPARVTQILQGAAGATAGLSSSPEPTVQFTGLDATSLDFMLTAWAPDYDSAAGLRSELTSRIYAALAEAGIEIPRPQQELHLKVAEDAKKISDNAGAPAN